MAALTGPRDTKARGDVDSGRLDQFGVADATTIYQGAICCLNAAGEVVPGTVSTSLTALGRADNSHPLSTSADQFLVGTRVGMFAYDSGTAGDAITKADRGKVCYIIDDQTVGLTDGGATRSKAGRVYDVDAEGVWVDFVYPMEVGA